MLFNSWLFWGYFALVLLLYFGLPERFSKYVLLVACFVFYGAWNVNFVFLLGGYILFNYGSGLAIGRAQGRRATLLLCLAVAANIATLGFFKYYMFFVSNLGHLFAIPEEFRLIRIVLPVAISFYTFEAIAYNMDVWRRVVAPRRNLLDFSLFMSFFPRLIAGPIIRPAQFLPQLAARRAPSTEDIRWGVFQILKGLIKKTVFADQFAIMADAYYNTQIGQGLMVAAWVGAFAFAMQIYFDFSGYTDIARGCARLLGFDLPRNFDRPYLASDIADFWRRWHISLSSWLRDYLYIPLGGSRRGPARTLLNLLLTMALGGLWHGASWNFLLWGIYHGLLLCLHRGWRAIRGEGRPATRLGGVAGVALTFLVVLLGWVPFRAPDFASTTLALSEMFTGSLVGANVPFGLRSLTGLALLWCWLDRGERLQSWLMASAGWSSVLRISGAVALALLVIEMFAVTDLTVPFVYFQF